MLYSLRTVPFLFLLFVLTGCLQFDAQEITLHYDEKHDRLDALLVYRGLYGNETAEEDIKQLRSVLETGEFAIWSNWPAKVNLVAARGLMKPFADHCEAENGSLFVTPTGEMCAYQMVRVNDVKGMLKKLNTAIAGVISTQILGQKLGPDGHEFDDDTKELLLEVTRGRLDVVQLQGSAVVVTLPCSDADHAWMLRQLGDRLLGEVGRQLAQRLFDTMQTNEAKPADASETRTVSTSGHGTRSMAGPDAKITATRTEIQRHLAALAEARVLFANPWTLQRTAEQTVFTLGFPHAKTNTVTKPPTGLDRKNLQAMLDEAKIAYEQGVPDQELQRRFQEFHGRAAVLPVLLKERREAEKK
ncbi:MAG: hypothetical protein IPK26_29690 [Planctomycetes bacterium]|nr:hypothetical protein [Planctomycetota bacterium]